MDLTLDVGEYKLNIRAACIIKHNNKILFHKNAKKDHYCIIGGRIEIGENSEQTVKREVMEELGKEIEITGYAATIENFFEMDNKKYHEIMFIYYAEFKDKDAQKIETTLDNCEGNDYLKYEWIDVDELNNYNILPKVLKNLIVENKFPIHKIHID